MIAIVTGAASGIGEAIARKFIAKGCSVHAIDRDENALRRFAESMTVARDRLALGVHDVAERDAPAGILAECRAALGEPEVLVNNAGFANAREALQTSDDSWERYIDVNLGSVFRMSRAFVEHCAKGGAVVNVASVFGLVGFRGSAPYSAAKAGVAGLTRQMAADYGRRGFRFNAVAPGIIATPATAERIRSNRWLTSAMIDGSPLGRVGEPDDVADAVYFLAGAEARFITGVTLPVDGGWSSTRYHPDLEEDV